jgi:hypothetical protein
VQDLVAQNRLDIASWFDYGAFCMRVGDLSKAEECFREVVSIDQRHEQSLILLGVLSFLAVRYAEVMMWSVVGCLNVHRPTNTSRP